MKAYKRNMSDQILSNDKHILYCRNCDAEFSGNAGDYWQYPENHLFHCHECGGEMELVEKVVSVKYV